jgi:hypothetical protein
MFEPRTAWSDVVEFPWETGAHEQTSTQAPGTEEEQREPRNAPERLTASSEGLAP